MNTGYLSIYLLRSFFFFFFHFFQQCFTVSEYKFLYLFNEVYRHPSVYLALLYCVFYKLKVCGNPCIKQTDQHHFSTSICSLSGHFHSISSFFIIDMFVTVMVTVYLDVTNTIVSGHHKPLPHKTVNLTTMVCKSMTTPVTHSLPLTLSPPQASLYPETRQY